MSSFIKSGFRSIEQLFVFAPILLVEYFSPIAFCMEVVKLLFLRWWFSAHFCLFLPIILVVLKLSVSYSANFNSKIPRSVIEPLNQIEQTIE